MTNKQPEALYFATMLEVSDKHPELINVNNRAAAELRRLHKIERAFDLWIEKTEWVQESCAAKELGMHRADVMKQRIDRLHEVNAELVEALRECTAWMEDLRASGDAGNWEWEADEYTRAIAALAKATGEQQ